MGQGLLGTIGMMVTVVFAVPVAFLGVNLLLDGSLYGGVFLGIAVAMVLVEKYVTMPWDVPELVLGKLFGSSGESETDGEETPRQS